MITLTEEQLTTFRIALSPIILTFKVDADKGGTICLSGSNKETYKLSISELPYDRWYELTVKSGIPSAAGKCYSSMWVNKNKDFFKLVMKAVDATIERLVKMVPFDICRITFPLKGVDVYESILESYFVSGTADRVDGTNEYKVRLY